MMPKLMAIRYHCFPVALTVYYCQLQMWLRIMEWVIKSRPCQIQRARIRKTGSKDKDN